MTDKEKMTEIIQKVLTRDVNTIERKAERMTNALIGAGFVSDETRHKRNVQAVVRAQELIKGIEYIRVHEVNARNYAFHRAEVAERALLLMARGECTFAPPEFYKEEAEREVAEEEHIMANRCGEGKCEYFESIRRAANNNREYGYCKKYKQDLHLYDWWWLKCDECTAEKELAEEEE